MAAKTAQKSDLAARISALGWDLYRSEESYVQTSEYAGKTDSSREHVKVIPGDYAAHKRVGDRLVDIDAESMGDLLDRIEAWENHEVPR